MAAEVGSTAGVRECPWELELHSLDLPADGSGLSSYWFYPTECREEAACS